MVPSYQFQGMTGPLTLTVRELIAELQKIVEAHGDLAVITEGCDCEGSAASLQVIGSTVLICRWTDPEEDD